MDIVSNYFTWPAHGRSSWQKALSSIAGVSWVWLTWFISCECVQASPVSAAAQDFCLNVRNFGAVGDGITDDTNSLQSAINAARALRKSLLLPAGNYLVTRSLNCTFADESLASTWLIGEGLGLTSIIGNLDEPFPILDMSGNTRGGIRNLAIIARTGKASCCVYSAKPSKGGNLGNLFTVDRCLLELFATGQGAINQAALVYYNTDLSLVRDSEIYGPRAFVGGFNKPKYIRSKYQTDPDRPDSTMLKLENSIFNAWAGPAVEFTGGASISLDNCYLAAVGNGYQAILQVSGEGGKSVYARNIRIENQSTFQGLSAIRLLAPSNQGDISGALETGPSDFSIDASHAPMSAYRLNVLNSLGTLFRKDSVLRDVEVITNCRKLGEISSNSSDLQIHGRLASQNPMRQVGR